MFQSLLLLFALLSAQAPDRTASIEGVVLSRGSEIPAADVEVYLERESSSGSEPMMVMTDQEGKYAFRGLGAGAYRLGFARNGFVAQEYGQRARSGKGLTVSLARGQQLKGVDVFLTPTGTVTGRITDERGRPLEGIYVELFKQTFTPEGELGNHEVASARTNDRGEYRLYWIPPGRYYITAEPKSGGESRTSELIKSRNYEGSYYPGRLELSTAIAITVEPGGEASGIDWSLLPASPVAKEGYRLRGTIVDSRTGQPPRKVSVTLSSRTGSGTWNTTGNGNFNSSTGTFELTNVEPGAYWLDVTSTDATSGRPDQIAGQMFLTMPAGNLDGVALTLLPGITIRGRVRFEGDSLSAAEAEKIRIGFTWKGAHKPWNPPALQKPNADGSLTIANLPPGPYKLAMQSAPENYFIKEARLGATDILGQSLEVLNAVSGSLEIVLSSRSGQVDGVVVDSRRQPLEGIEAVLIPDQQGARTDLFRTATSDREGRFRIVGIPPGNYKLFAWENAEPYAYFDPEVVRQAEPFARLLRVGPSASEVVELRSIP